jgi:hypothetical protein
VSRDYFHLRYALISLRRLMKESTGLEALLGQALTLDDEPTLVRAVKSVKRTIARNEKLKKAYFGLAFSGVASIAFIVGIKYRTDFGVVCGLVILAGGLRSMVALVQLVVAGILGLPIIGIAVPYHPVLLRIYNPAVQVILRYFGAFIIIGQTLRDVILIINLKREEWETRKKEKRERQEKLKGIFYTPTKPISKPQSNETAFRKKSVFTS